MIHIPPDLVNLVDETDRLTAEIRSLRAKERPTDTELRRMAVLKMMLCRTCPPERFAWVDGLPVIDILKTLKQEEARKHERID